MPNPYVLFPVEHKIYRWHSSTWVKPPLFIGPNDAFSQQTRAKPTKIQQEFAHESALSIAVETQVTRPTGPRTPTRPRARGQEDAFERPRKRHRPFGSERIAHQDGKGDGHQVLHARSAEESHRASSRRATQAALTASLLGHSEQGLSQAHELSLVKRLSAPRNIDFCRVE